MGSMMSSMGGGGMPLGESKGGGQGGKMATESVMGMDVPDFMGNVQQSFSEQSNRQSPFKGTASPATQMPSQTATAPAGGTADAMMAGLNQQKASMMDQADNAYTNPDFAGAGIGNTANTGEFGVKGLPRQNYGLNLGGASNLNLGGN